MIAAMHRGGLVAAAFAVVGCFGKPGFSGGAGDARVDSSGGGDAGGDDDASDGPLPDGCTGAWGAPTVFHELDGLVGGEPTITADLKTIYFSTMVGSRWEVHWADRPNTTSPFTPRGHLAGDPGSMLDQDPTVTADGKLIIFRVSQQGAIMQAEDTGSGFVVGNVPGLGGLVVDTMDISGDGRTFYYMKNSQLRTARRTQRSNPFTTDPGTYGNNLHWPAITGDALHLYYTMLPNSYGVYEASRLTTNDAFFGTTMLLGPNYHDADVTEDGATIVVGDFANNSVAILHRGCP